MNIRDALHILEIASANYVNNDRVDGKSSLIEQLVDRDYTDKILDHYNYMIKLEPNYTLLDALCNVIKNAEITKHKQEIAYDYITSTKWDLLTRLLSRDVYKNIVRNILKRENKFGTTTLRYINTDSRFDTIYYQFVKTFEKDSVGSFSNGHYGGYIAHAFQQYFFKEHKKDIWYSLREVDVAKKETDMKQSITNVELSITDNSDFYINDLLKNIYQANIVLFKHNGHTLNTVVYDIFHLCVNHRIESYFNKLNEKLQTFHIELIDTGRPQLMIDSNTGKIIEERIKGASSKIGNGLKMIPILYDYVRDKKLNMNAIGDLREYAFLLGKDAISDSNCVWKLEPIAHCTERRIDNSDGIRNYKSFEVILKGVISVYALINGLESRGVSPVSMYDEDLFKNIEVIRYMDFLSSVKYKDLMLQLQKSNLPQENCPVLDTFEKAVHDRSGSIENNRSDNQERRQKALLNGLLVNPPLKKQKTYDDFGNLYNVYLQISALPRSLALYKVLQLEDGNLLQDRINQILNLTELPYEYIGSILVRSNRYNKILKSKPTLTSEYLTAYMPIDLSYNILFPYPSDELELYLIFNGEEAMLDRETNTFTLGGFIYLANDVLKLYNEKVNDSIESDFQIVEKPFKQETYIKLFDIRLQLSESLDWQHLNTLNKIIKYNYSKEACIKFNMYYIELSVLQEDFISFIEEFKNLVDSICLNEVYTHYCREILIYFKRNEFKQQILEPFLIETISRNHLGDISEMDSDTLIELLADRKNLNVFVRLLLYVQFKDLLISYEESLSDLLKLNESNTENLYSEFISLVNWNDVDTLSKVFIYFYNYINTKLEFFTAIRDIYDILFLVPNEIQTLTSELSSRYRLNTILSNMVSNIPEGISLDTIDDIVSIDFIREVFKVSIDTHNFIIKLYTRYINSCNGAFENILDYNFIGKTIAKDEFKHWGDMFNLTKMETDIPSLDKLRELYSVDDSGFFIRNSEYFKGFSNDGTTEYFIHRTGKLLVQNSNGSYSSVNTLNLDKDLTEEERKNELDEIITRGLLYVKY